MKDIKFEPVKGGIHAGGQHAQKNSTGVRATHEPSGIVVVMRGRSLVQSKRRAVKAIKRQLSELRAGKLAARKKSRRDWAIHNMRVIRTYAYHRGVVKDHRTGKVASVSDVVDKGRIDLLR